ncbi:hypothetical protein [Nocardioides sp. R-C-SC26]|uniref:hypothetical protein n=1 Tax=Nocardioides sp. R-C-SC26 TaxID=2870414 RepID=UPI001E375D31|nr:hypothetical protein [Nocardioides sp. R-C-SC26]
MDDGSRARHQRTAVLASRADVARAAIAALLAATVATAVGLLTPTLALDVDGSATLTGAVVAVAVAALLRTAHGAGWLTVPAAWTQIHTRRAAPVVLAARPTDPTHHPLRPRAPGTR